MKSFLWVVGFCGLLSMIPSALGQIEIAATGKVGIGTSSPAHTLDVMGSGRFTGTLSLTAGSTALFVTSQQTNTGSGRGIHAAHKLVIDESGSYYPIANTGYARQISDAGVRNDGYLMGFDGGGFRTDPDDAGSLGTLYGMRLQYGHYSTLNGLAHTDTIIGLNLQSYYQAGTIGNVYGIIIGGLSGANVVGNMFGLYQSDGAAKNYFAGNVGIGATNPTHKLQVAGSVRASSFISDTVTYADFVFRPDYHLAPLSEVEAHIAEYGHLPDIPSEAEARENGIDLAVMQVKLLQKVEEITLHQIAQEKAINALRQENAELRAQLKQVEALK